MTIIAEQSTLGGIILGGLNTLEEVTDSVSVDDFIRHEHRHMYEVMLKMQRDKQEIDINTIESYIDTNICDYGFIVNLVRTTNSSENTIHYARAVRDTALKGNLGKIMTNAYNQLKSNLTAKEQMEVISNQLAELMEQSDSNSPQHISTFLSRYVDELETRFNADGEIVGLSTGFTDIDKKTSGLHDGHMIVVAGRPAMGKTSFAINVAENVAHQGKTALIFSMEMEGLELVSKSISSTQKVDFNSLKTGQVHADDWQKITNGLGRMKESNIIIDESSGLTINEIKTRSRTVKRKHGLDLIVIDYIQLMRGSTRNRTEDISDISRNIKVLAKELKVPIIALSQLNRACEARSDKRPMLSDLKESGSIEQDADVVIFLYRDEVYDENSTHKGIAEAIFRKQRSGTTGTVYLKSNLDVSRFDDFTDRFPEPAQKKYSDL